MFIAVAKMPEGAEGPKRAAALTGQALADAARSLAGVLPRILLRAVAAEEAGRLVAALEAEGFVAFAGEASAVPTDKDRVVARNLEWTDAGFAVLDGRGQRHECPFAAVSAFLRGVKLNTTTEIVKTSERRLSIGKTLATGGLPIMKTVVTTSERTTADKEGFLLVQRSDGQSDIILYEQRLNYQCLGAELQPSRHSNLVALSARLRACAPEAPLDDRITRTGFLGGLPLLAADPMDLALYLVAQARLRGC